MITRNRHLATDLVHAARVCACPNCKRLAREAADKLLVSLAFDFAEQNLRNARELRFATFRNEN
jgi:hypothetical protein